MKKVLILCIALLGCAKDNPQPCGVTISNANPIQFWLTGEESFNDKEICSILPVCFCQKFLCSDLLSFQFTHQDYSKSFRLRIYDSALLQQYSFRRSILYETPITTALNFLNPTFQGGVITPWGNGTGGFAGNEQNFQWISNGSAQASSAFNNTKVFYQERPNTSLRWPPGTYTISITGINASTGGSSPFQSIPFVYASNDQFVTRTAITTDATTGTTTLVVGAGTQTGTITFSTDRYWKDLGIQYVKSGVQGGYSVNITLNDVHITSAPTLDATSALYDLSFRPSNSTPDLCGKNVRFEIVDSTTNQLYAFSDCVEIADDVDDDCTVLIEYSNSTNFAGLYYPDVSPAFTPQLRIKAVFFEESFPEGYESIDLSDSEIVQLWAEAKHKKNLDIDFQPFYMIEKLILVLKHDSVTIDGDPWVQGDPLNIVSGNKRYPLRRSNVLLTEKDYIQRNVL